MEQTEVAKPTKASGETKKRVREPKKSRWCFTWNNYPIEYSEEEIEKGKFSPNMEKWEYVLRSLNDVRYMVAGKEVAPTTGTPHIQGFLRFHNGVTLKWLCKRVLHCSFRVAFGTDKDQDYCKKDGQYITYGHPAQQGKRSDIIAIREAVCAGWTFRKMFEEIIPNAQGVKVAQIALDYYEPERNGSYEDFTLSWYHGPTGTGKTTMAYREHPEYYFFTMDTLKWFQGYDAHEGLIIDDLRETVAHLCQLLKLFQPFPMRVETKGGMRQMRAMHFIVTSCYAPWEFYRFCGEDIRQLLRRLTCLRTFTGYCEYNEYKKEGLAKRLSEAILVSKESA